MKWKGGTSRGQILACNFESLTDTTHLEVSCPILLLTRPPNFKSCPTTAYLKVHTSESQVYWVSQILPPSYLKP